MSFYDFLTNSLKKKSSVAPARREYTRQPKPMSIKQMMDELGVRTSGAIGTYQEEEKPDARTIDQYIHMQDNDGTVRAVTHLFSTPIQSTPIKILAAEGDNGERDFIEKVFLGPQREGGMSTPLPFIIADMTRAIFEGFRLYEKIPQVIKEGRYKGKIGWRKLAIRDAKTINLRADRHGGFLGAHQQATFGGNFVNINIPPEKCMLFTFQKEKHPLYGESILKTAYYHYDKKHKLYYLAHKKAEIDAVGLKIIKLGHNLTENEVSAAENAVDSIGANTRLTIPENIDLEINRAQSGYDVLPLIDHHDSQIVMSTLSQAIQMGSKSTYNYTYGSGYQTQSEFIIQTLHAIMKNIEDTINEWAVAPLIDWNFGTGCYPRIKLMPLKDKTQEYLMKVFESLIKKDPTYMPNKMAVKMAKEVAENLGLDIAGTMDEEEIEQEINNKQKESKKKEEKKTKKDKEKEEEIKEEKVEKEELKKAFEFGKRNEADVLKVQAPSTTKLIKQKIDEIIELADFTPAMLSDFEQLGREFARDPKNFRIDI